MHKVIRFVRICMTSQSESLTTVLFVKLAESLFFYRQGKTYYWLYHYFMTHSLHPNKKTTGLTHWPQQNPTTIGICWYQCSVMLLKVWLITNTTYMKVLTTKKGISNISIFIALERKIQLNTGWPFVKHAPIVWHIFILYGLSHLSMTESIIDFQQNLNSKTIMKHKRQQKISKLINWQLAPVSPIYLLNKTD